MNVKNIEEDPSLTLNRLQVRAGVELHRDNHNRRTWTDPDGANTGITYTWYVPKVSRPDLENEDHWNGAPGGVATNPNGDTYTTDAGDAGKYLRVVATYTDPAGTGAIKRTRGRLIP